MSGYFQYNLKQLCDIITSNIQNGVSNDLIKITKKQYINYFNLMIQKEEYEICGLIENIKHKMIIKKIFISKNKRI